MPSGSLACRETKICRSSDRLSNPRSNIQCTVPESAIPLLMMSGPFASTGRDMRRSDLRATTAVYQLQSADGTALGVGSQHNPTKNAVTHDPRNRKACSIAAPLELKRRLLVPNTQR